MKSWMSQILQSHPIQLSASYLLPSHKDLMGISYITDAPFSSKWASSPPQEMAPPLIPLFILTHLHSLYQIQQEVLLAHLWNRSALQAFPPPSTAPTLPKPLLPFTEAAAISAQLVPLPLGVAHIASGVLLLIWLRHFPAYNPPWLPIIPKLKPNLYLQVVSYKIWPHPASLIPFPITLSSHTRLWSHAFSPFPTYAKFIPTQDHCTCYAFCLGALSV